MELEGLLIVLCYVIHLLVSLVTNHMIDEVESNRKLRITT